jgi:hypothetical protein
MSLPDNALDEAIDPIRMFHAGLPGMDCVDGS